eukprot:Blabericola_migrator_1__117@NODE_102_length_14292_cov_312_776380_g90_i0_p4_GENE_NODE_102_length_14292_cov_312_776380_g90_i0NODE_102_length_14292_cov_312_776380_g90_i0_p4_ORF_typecomplete_len526_score47_25DHHC/PF01529_20/6_5e02DHHC/PF01529_20/1_3e41FlhE/PF06366_13/0_35Pho86/PF11124_8/1_57tm_7/PF08395_12/7e027tm_7/PF08395_12/0_049Cornichon/PF03311_14/1_8e04Cornichon/PF03311_14/0_27_NODE_102_length_14292_cov_312_776380_g90_i049976574
MKQRSSVGNVRYVFGGRCIVGPDVRLSIVAFLLILFPSIIYDAWSLPWMVRRWPGATLLAVCAVVIELVVMTLFIRTAFSDPGIVPREVDLWGEDTPWLNQLMPKNPPKHQDIVIHGHLFKMKYCASCNFYRPPRCVHCSVCDNCVDKFDHHCPWVGNCVGRRNYRSFLLFIFFTSVFILLVMVTSPIKFFQCIQDYTPDYDFATSFKMAFSELWDSLLLTLFAFGFLWFVLGLAGYHFYLISSNQTTYEQIKGFFEEKMNPWDRGLARNLNELLCRRRRPKFTFRPRGPVVYSRFQNVKIGTTGRIDEGGILKMKLPLCLASNYSMAKSLLGGDAVLESTRSYRTPRKSTGAPTPQSAIEFQSNVLHGAEPPSDISSNASDGEFSFDELSLKEWSASRQASSRSRLSSMGTPKGKAICVLCRATSCNCLDKMEGSSNVFRTHRAHTEQLDSRVDECLPVTRTEDSPLDCDTAPPPRQNNQSFVEIDRPSSRDTTLISWLKRAGDWGRLMSKTELGRWTCVLPED